MNGTKGMIRQPDHITSGRAAGVVIRTRETLKSRVIQAAKDAGPGGFVDSDLLSIDPSRPESSFRKRRTELAEKNIILDAGYTRPNGHGQDSTVWVHRSHVPNPPPIVEAPKRLSAAEEERAKIVHWMRVIAGTIRDKDDGASASVIAAGIDSTANLIEARAHL